MMFESSGRGIIMVVVLFHGRGTWWWYAVRPSHSDKHRLWLLRKPSPTTKSGQPKAFQQFWVRRIIRILLLDVASSMINPCLHLLVAKSTFSEYLLGFWIHALPYPLVIIYVAIQNRRRQQESHWKPWAIFHSYLKLESKCLSNTS